MTRAYGAPTERNADYVTFERDRAAWRYRPAEILFWAGEIDADIACIYAVLPGRCAHPPCRQAMSSTGWVPAEAVSGWFFRSNQFA